MNSYILCRWKYASHINITPHEKVALMSVTYPKFRFIRSMGILCNSNLCHNYKYFFITLAMPFAIKQGTAFPICI